MTTPTPRRSGGQATNRERQDSFRIRQERAGLRRVEVWVPDGTQDRLRAFAAQLQDEAHVTPD